MSPTDGRALLANVLEILRPDFDETQVGLELRCEPVIILADTEMLRQIVVNLLLNALAASAPGSTVAVRLHRVGESVTLEVEDQGSGIPPELLPNVFKPYVTGDAEGHGLGLAIVQRFVNEQGWAIDLQSVPGRGTKVTITGIGVAEPSESRE